MRSSLAPEDRAQHGLHTRGLSHLVLVAILAGPGPAAHLGAAAVTDPPVVAILAGPGRTSAARLPAPQVPAPQDVAILAGRWRSALLGLSIIYLAQLELRFLAGLREPALADAGSILVSNS